MDIKDRRIFDVGFVLVASVFAIKFTFIFLTTDINKLLDYHYDDAYYYYQIAYNIADTGMVSFDNINQTNGFHPLWLISLIPFFELTDSKIQVLRPIGVFTVVILSASSLFSYMYMRSKHNPISIALSIYLYYSILIIFVGLNMEVSLLLLLICLLFFLSNKYSIWDLSEANLKEIASVGLIMALIPLARLDAVILTIVLSTYVLVNNIKNITYWLYLNIPSIIMGVSYMSINFIYFGHFMPISGEAKSLTTPINSTLIAQLSSELPVALKSYILNIPVSLLYVSVYDLTVIVVSAFILYSLLRLSALNREDIAGLSPEAKVVIIFSAIYTIYYILLSSYPWWHWYFYPVALLSVYFLPTLTDTIVGLFKINGVKSRHIQIIAVLLLILPGLMIVSAGQGDGPADDKYELAQETNEYFEDETVLAYGDGAGAFGYFSNHSVVQTECLVQDYDCINALKSGTFQQYLEQNGVDYLFIGGGVVENSNYIPAGQPSMRHLGMKICEEARIYPPFSAEPITERHHEGKIWSVDKLDKC